jgi:hypothetical protein
MTFFYDLNKRLADLAAKQDAKQISEDAKATAPKSKLAESIEVAETGYSAKAGRAGKDLGKPGKNFAKIAQTAGAKYGSKAAGERVAGAVLNKLRHPTEEAAAPMTPKQKSFAKLAPPADKITFADKIAGAKKEVDEMLGDVAAEAMRGALRGGQKKLDKNNNGKLDSQDFAMLRKGGKKVADEGNAFTGALKSTPKGGKFKVGGKEFTDTSDIEEGFEEMHAWLAQREKEKGTGKFDKKERTMPGGMKATTYTRRHDDDAEDDSDDSEKSSEPKRRGRPKGKAKGPERVTAKAWKHKGERKAKSKVKEDGCCPHCGGSLNEPELDEEKVEAGKREFFDRLAPAAKKAAKVIKVMSKGKAPVDEESTDKEDTKAEKAGKKVAKDIEHDEGHKGKDDNRAEKAGKKVTKDIEYDDKKDRKEKKADKEEKVDETTVAGSVATATPSGKSSGGMTFGKGVYENFNNTVEKMITESIEVSDTITENEGKTITVTASGPEADMLMQLLKAAGLSGQSSGCGCGQTPCGCGQTVDEAYGDTDETKNSPDWPTNTETLDAEPNLRTYSGGLNGPKSTGQTTTPVIASQLRRQVSMEENVELERALFKTWKNYKG